MPRLSSPTELMKEHYTVLVVGSGYGAAIAASRLARAGQSVGLLERGREIQPGEYPAGEVAALAEAQVDLPSGHHGPRRGLYDVRVNPDINVVVGCGLGGTSLINANVALAPDEQIFQQEHFPRGLRDDLASLRVGFDRAREMLRPQLYPEHFPSLPKLEAHAASARALGREHRRLPITVAFADGVNHVGVEQKACVLCGDCVSGCNHGAKSTLLMNYLPDARRHGAEIFTGVEVRRIERRGERWIVHFRRLDAGVGAFDAPLQFVSADLVVLGAGTLGSTEILLRSRGAGLPLSPRIGQRFTGNGDLLGFAYDTERVVDGIGFGDRAIDPRRPVGPTITSLIDYRPGAAMADGFIVEEGAIPGALGRLAMAMLAVQAASGLGDHSAEASAGKSDHTHRIFDQGPRTQTYLVMTCDDDAGSMRLDDDRLRVDWPGDGRQAVFKRIEAELERVAAAIGGDFIDEPLWTRLFQQRLVTVHPLGGCVMAEGADRGVVDHRGRVFTGHGADVHPGLYVCDGAIVPAPLGVNPLLTICALAERASMYIAAERGWQIDYALDGSAEPAAAEVRPGIRFTEAMQGFFSSGVKGPRYEEAARRGEDEGSRFEFVLTVAADDVAKLIEDPQHEARLSGTAAAPALGLEVLTVTDGVFNLFVVDPDDAASRLMRYRMKLTREDGKTFCLTGFKRLHDDPGFDMWQDATTLFITVHEGDDDQAPVLGRGVLRVHVDDFVRQLRSIEITGEPSLARRLAWEARFGKFFAGTLFAIYGGLAARVLKL